MPNEKLEVNIDASSLSSSACIFDWYNTIVSGYREPLYGASMIYGTAVHKYIDTMYQTGDMKLSIQAARDSFNRPKRDSKKASWLSDERHMLATSFRYWEDYLMKDGTFDLLKLPNGKPATELTFRIKYYEDDYIIVYLCGTMDKVGQIKGGCFAIGDYKTTSKYQVKEFLEEFELKAQLRFYRFALSLMHLEYPDSVLGQIGGQQVGGFIEGIFLKAKVMDNVHERSEVFQFSDEQMKEFVSILDYKIKDLSSWIQLGFFPKEGIVNGACKKEYGLCKFWAVCRSREPKVQELLLSRDFHKVKYDPLKFGEL